MQPSAAYAAAMLEPDRCIALTPTLSLAGEGDRWGWFAMIALLVFGAAAVDAADVTGRVTDAAGNGVAEAVVFVQELPEGVTAPDGPRTAVVDQVNKEFVPHVLPIAVGTEVSFPNHDQIHHHVYSFSRSKTFEIPLYKGESAPPVRFDQAGAVKIGCNIHDWMSGVILVVPTPYFAVTDATGAFALRDLPNGSYRLAAWHEGSKAAPDETVQTAAAGEGAAPVTFTLDIVPRPRPARGRSDD
jgi:plastocyanin